MAIPVSLTHQAIIFATQAHQGQVRKQTSIPYIVHPFEVAQILTLAGEEEPLIVAGLLHDTLEDTPTTPEALQELFGPKVFEYVAAVTENKSLTWEERRAETLEFLEHRASREILMLTCADKLSNLRSIAEDLNTLGDAPVFWKRFNRGKEKQCWFYRSMLQALAPLKAEGIYQEYHALCQVIFPQG